MSTKVTDRVDAFGTPVVVGDTVAFANASSRYGGMCIGLTVGKICRLTPKGATIEFVSMRDADAIACKFRTISRASKQFVKYTPTGQSATTV